MLITPNQLLAPRIMQSAGPQPQKLTPGAFAKAYRLATTPIINQTHNGAFSTNTYQLVLPPCGC